MANLKQKSPEKPGLIILVIIKVWNGLHFEIAGTETGTENNIRNGLKHCASKTDTEVAVLYFPNENFSTENFEKGLRKYNGLKGDELQYKKFKKIICISGGKIVYEKSHK